MRTLFFLVLSALVLVGCSQPTVPYINVQMPAKIAIEPKLTKLFLDLKTFDHANDQLILAPALVLSLKKTIEAQGRFQVIFGPVHGVDPNLEPVGVIQGILTSHKEEDTGQRTEIATCEGGIGGALASVSAAQSSKQGVTFSGGFLSCRSGSDIRANSIAAGISILNKLAGKEEDVNPLVQVVRVYKYKNFNFFAQADFTLTYLGTERKTLVIRSDTADFSRHLVQPAINVHTSILTWVEAMPLMISPITPVLFRPIGIVDASNPASPEGAWYRDQALIREDMTEAQKTQVKKQLIDKVLWPFIKTVSPYTAKIEAEIARDGESEAVKLLLKGDWLKARQRLKQQDSKSAADLYNLGLTFEAQATSADDYIQAKDYYQQALTLDENMIFARGIGRMERRLVQAKILKEQTKG